MDQAASEKRDDTTGVGSVLLRKTRLGQEVRQTHSTSLAKALRLSLAKVADQQMGLALAVLVAKVEVAEQEALAELFEGAPLLMLLDGTVGRRGAAVFDSDLVGALIQQQTMGRVTPPLGGEPRKMTDTDAAICAPFLEAVMARAAGMPDDKDEQGLLDGYSFGARVGDTRLLMMALEQPAYHVVRLTLDVAGGARQGHITLCLPPVPRAGQNLSDLEDTEENAPPAPLLDKTVLALEVELHVALTSLTMPLGAVQRMVKGEVFDLGITAFDEACVQTVQGRRLGNGVLGQINGTRALQLEHEKVKAHQPRRRASDRATLNLPNVGGDGTGTRREDMAAGPLADLDDGNTFDGTLNDMAPQPAVKMAQPAPEGSVPDLPPLDGLPDLPDMSDLPGMDDLADLPDLPELDMTALGTGS